MRDLKQCREDIDRIDNQILKLLQERLGVAIDIADYKLNHNQSITDPIRENAKLVNLREKAHSLQIPPSFITDLYKGIMKHTCAVEQHYIIEKSNNSKIDRDSSVSFLGTTGSYSHVAATTFLENFVGNITTQGCQTFSQVVGLVETGKCAFGVLPIENSSSGSINDVLDVIQTTQASIVGELFVPIDHAILGNSDVKLDEITDVYSHPQPVAQCSMWLKDVLPNVKIHYTKATSEAMEIVKNLNDPKHVAIGSQAGARFYDLLPAFTNIANNIHNFTRFIVVSMSAISVPESIKAKTSISFTVQKYVPGSLIKVLSEFSKRNINVTKLISRPKLHSDQNTWEEIFFADVEANLASSDMQDIIEDIKPYTNFFKVLGCYPNSEKKS